MMANGVWQIELWRFEIVILSKKLVIDGCNPMGCGG